MNRKIRTGLRMLALCAAVWYTGHLCQALVPNRATAAMILLLEVLGISTFGDSVLALVASAVASLSFSFYFLDEIGSVRLTSVQGTVTFTVMAITALTGSQLSIRAQRRMREAIHRREEMERLHQLGRVLIAADTLVQAAENAVRVLVELFGLEGALLRVEGAPHIFQWGTATSNRVSVVPLDSKPGTGIVELYGARLSDEVASAIASMIRLVLERAKSSEERAALESASRGEELRSTVLNALAHNFKTPLTSIKAAASTLRGSAEIISPHGRELITVIDEEADRLNRLIHESLALARLEDRQADQCNEECPVSAVVECVVARLERFLSNRELIIEIPGNLPSIRGDSFLLEQMLLQVVDNAIKYSRPGTPIRISAARVPGNVILTVRNEGTEIPESERERIFEKFYRGSRDRLAVEGTGLGLVIARTIAVSYGGRLWLENEPKGPAFSFALPLQEKERLHDREPHYLTH